MRPARPVPDGIGCLVRAQAPLRLVAAFSLALLVAGCTATQTREHTRESYQPPKALTVPASRIFAQEPAQVYDALFAWLLVRSVEIEEADVSAGRLVADLRFGSDAVQESAVDMGFLNTVITRTRRRYKSYWPFEARCDACIIRRGNLISSDTELVRDLRVRLSPADYEIAALLRAKVTEAADGARVELSVAFEVHPNSPPGIDPVSTGLLEETVFQALEQALHE